MFELGPISRLQIQNGVLKAGSKDAPFYDPRFIVSAPALRLSAEGAVALLEGGQEVIDIHHAQHPQTRNTGQNPLSVGFTSHYAAMRERFGEHLTTGVAGENLIVDYGQRVTWDELGRKVAIHSAKRGDVALFEVVKVVAPCREFSGFCAQRPLEGEELKATLQFLHAGQRGFMLVLRQPQTFIVELGDIFLTANDF
jgi:hypothetical protein